MDLLSKIEIALKQCEETKADKINLELDYNEILLFKGQILVSDYQYKIMQENLKRAIQYTESIAR